MLLPLRDPTTGLLMPTTAASARLQRVPNPEGDLEDHGPPMPGNLPPQPFENMTDIPYSPPEGPAGGKQDLPRGFDLPSNLPQAGPLDNVTEVARTPRQTTTPRQDLMLRPSTVPGEPQIPPPGLPGANEPLAPSPGGGQAQPKDPAKPDARALLRDMAQVLVRSTSPAERVQGIQMLFEASQPTPGEVAQAERDRLSGIVDSAETVDPEMRNAAKIVAGLGGDARLITQVLGLDPESRRLDAQQRSMGTRKAQELVDAAYAPEYVKFRTGGGMRDAESNLQTLQNAREVLSTPGNVDPTGPIIGQMSDRLLALFPAGQRQITAKQLIETVGQRNLKEILGAQFAQKEGEEFLARVFNPKLEPEENMQRVGRLMTSLERAYQDKKDAADYFEANGTLKGFQGKLQYSLADFEQAVNQKLETDVARSRQVRPTPRPDLSDEVLLQQAGEAIAKGKNRDKVMRQLEEWGVKVRQ